MADYQLYLWTGLLVLRNYGPDLVPVVAQSEADAWARLVAVDIEAHWRLKTGRHLFLLDGDTSEGRALAISLDDGSIDDPDPDFPVARLRMPSALTHPFW
jgi:hypothetical protein